MKNTRHNVLLGSALGVLLISGAFAGDGKHGTTFSYGEGALYDNLQAIRTAADMTAAPKGAQGPVRTDDMAPAWSYGEGALYDNLRQSQPTRDESSSPGGARGPIRSDGMESGWSHEEGAIYDNLRSLQFPGKEASVRGGAQGPIRTESMDSLYAFGSIDEVSSPEP